MKGTNIANCSTTYRYSVAFYRSYKSMCPLLSLGYMVWEWLTRKQVRKLRIVFVVEARLRNKKIIEEKLHTLAQYVLEKYVLWI